MSMTEEMMEAIEKDLVFLATASSEGIPNVVPIGFARPINNGSILIADNYMNKTRQNIEENPNVAIVTKDAQKNPYQFKGKAEIFESGKIRVVEMQANQVDLGQLTQGLDGQFEMLGETVFASIS